MLTNLANKQTLSLVVLLDCKHGTELNFNSIEEKEAFCKGIAFINAKLDLKQDICLANNKYDVESYAMDQQDTFALV